MRLTIASLQSDTASLSYKIKVQENMLLEKEEQKVYLQKRLLMQMELCIEEKIKLAEEIKRGRYDMEGLLKENERLENLLREATPAKVKQKTENLGSTNTKQVQTKLLTNSTKSTKPSSSKTKSDNPFGGGGLYKEGNGSGKFGTDVVGPGSGPGGMGDGSGRVRLNDPVVDSIASDQNHTIYLRAQINAEGNIMVVTNLASKTTTSDQRIINQVMAAVKTQVRYSKKPGAGMELVFLTINLNGN